MCRHYGQVKDYGYILNKTFVLHIRYRANITDTPMMCYHHLPSDKVLQHRTFTSALATDHRYLGQVELHVHTQLGESILQLVNDGYQLFHAHVAGHRCGQQQQRLNNNTGANGPGLRSSYGHGRPVMMFSRRRRTSSSTDV